MTATDEQTLNRIVNDLSSNLIIEAGAGAGKTYALVSRVVSLVKGGARMRDIVAITFTEAAAAELSERVRSRLEQLLDERSPENAGDPLAKDLTSEEREWLERAVSELDEAAVQTIHSFAAQLLRERPLDAGLPPGWMNLDEIADSERFNERWEAWLESSLARDSDISPELAASLRYLAVSEGDIGKWKTVAQAIREDRHRLPDSDEIVESGLGSVVASTLAALNGLAAECSNPSDKLYQQLSGAIQTVEAVREVEHDPVAAKDALESGERVDYNKGVGAKSNWAMDPKEVRDKFRAAGQSFQAAVRFAPLAPMLNELGEFALRDEVSRKSDGVANFRDLLVWARDMLRDDPAARAQLQRRYSHILIDEFQDTDPLQAEIAFYLAAEPGAAVKERPWHTLRLTPGKLFVVGDDKQAIYRFRGADMGVTQTVKDGGRLLPLSLSENRRSQEPILDWVNAIFGECGLMEYNTGIQARYSSLTPNEALQSEDIDASAQLFGESVELAADPTRRREAQHLANIIVSSLSDGSSGLKVYDRSLRQVRKAKLQDICILIRSRTGLGVLTRQLEGAGIPYRIEGGSLLFDTQEVRDLLNCLRAIDDPSDEVSVVAALRSPALARSDLELLHWRDAGGPWNYMSSLLGERVLSNESGEARRQNLASEASLSSVRAGLLKLREYHELRQTTGVSRLISEFILERRLDELDLAESRPRETWRRRRFLTEQARTLEYGRMVSPEAQPLNLYQFVQWVELQQEERARIAEVVVPDTDDEAVRIMTMHASKGLEFPVVFILGLAQDPRRNDQALLFDPDTDTAEVKLGSLSSPGYSQLQEIEDAHSEAEQVRLAYVAATRARDHLFISMYRSTSRGNRQSKGVTSQIEACLPKVEGLYVEARAGAADEFKLAPAAPDTVVVEDYDPNTWLDERNGAIRKRSLPRAVTATGLARAAGSSVDREEIEDKDSEPEMEQAIIRGRGGTAFGSALHAVLQEIVESLAEDLPVDEGSTVDDVRQDLTDIIENLAEIHAAAHGVASGRGELAALAGQALRHPAVTAALRAPRLWSEIPVAGQVETERGPVVIEGIIDLLYQDHDGKLVIVDHKSDYVPNSGALSAKMDLYRWQGAAYASAVETATGMKVKDVQLLFVRANEARSVPDLNRLTSQLPEGCFTRIDWQSVLLKCMWKSLPSKQGHDERTFPPLMHAGA